MTDNTPGLLLLTVCHLFSAVASKLHIHWPIFQMKDLKAHRGSVPSPDVTQLVTVKPAGLHLKHSLVVYQGI